MDTSHSRGDSVSRGPRGLEKVEADFAGFEVDIGVADGGYEADGGGREGVG